MQRVTKDTNIKVGLLDNITPSKVTVAVAFVDCPDATIQLSSQQARSLALDLMKAAHSIEVRENLQKAAKPRISQPGLEPQLHLQDSYSVYGQPIP